MGAREDRYLGYAYPNNLRPSTCIQLARRAPRVHDGAGSFESLGWLAVRTPGQKGPGKGILHRQHDEINIAR